MKDSNKKGFISISVVYTFLILFVFLMLAILASYISRETLLSKLIDQAKEVIHGGIGEDEVDPNIIVQVYVDGVYSKLFPSYDYYSYDAQNSYCTNGAYLTFNYNDWTATIQNINGRATCEINFESGESNIKPDFGDEPSAPETPETPEETTCTIDADCPNDHKCNTETHQCELAEVEPGGGQVGNISNIVLDFYADGVYSATIPSKAEGYSFDPYASKCSDEAILTFNSTTERVNISNISKNTTCSAYFVQGEPQVNEDYVLNGNIALSVYVDNIWAPMFPSKNYYNFNPYMSNCTDNAILSFDDTNWNIDIINITDKTQCKVYFSSNDITLTPQMFNSGNVNLLVYVDGQLSSSVPQLGTGYYYHSDRSRCTNSATLTYDETGNKFNISDITRNTECFAYFFSYPMTGGGSGEETQSCGVNSDCREGYYCDTSTFTCALDPGGSLGPEYTDSSGANKPVLGNLIPIVRDGASWKYADVTKKWYDYNNYEWANAVVLKDGVIKSKGHTIENSDIQLWYVWIPRFEYKLPSASLGSTGTPQAIDINFVPENVTIPSQDGYVLHPGFTFSGLPSAGMWVAKFEATGEKTSMSIQPNSASLVNLKIKELFDITRGMETTYSSQFNNKFDSHPARFLEWSAVAYLTNSVKGRCITSTTCNEVSSTQQYNNAYVTGGGNYENNVSYSSTGNVYGVYDLSGGAWEYVMGVLKDNYVSSNVNFPNGYANSTFTTEVASKYYDVFTSSNPSTTDFTVLTHVNNETTFSGFVYEILTSKSATSTWFGDSTFMVTSEFPWFRMGGYSQSQGNTAGIFAVGTDSGTSVGTHAFRPVLTVK